MKRIGAILAGGMSARMGADKATLDLEGRRIVEHVIERFGRQLDRLVISGPDDYGAGLTAIADEVSGLKGPAAGVYAVSRWLKENEPNAEGFFTTPVDGPFLPEDLCDRLSEAEGSAVAEGDVSVHPPFAWWRLQDLEKAFRELSGAPSVSLRALAKAANARHVRWKGDAYFFNINTREDLDRAGALLRQTP